MRLVLLGGTRFDQFYVTDLANQRSSKPGYFSYIGRDLNSNEINAL